MPIPVWMLLAFAVWTVALLFATVGIYRWSHILTGRVPMRDFKADQVEGADWYKRAMRAHANCVENLPVFGALVFVLFVSGTTGPGVDLACMVIMGARVVHSLVHVAALQTNAVVSVRFAFYLVQALGYFYLAGAVVRHVGFTVA